METDMKRKKRSDVVIDGRAIGYGHPPYIIAELSGNHNGSLETALNIVDRAAATGAHAVKLQTYRPDTITLDSARDDFQIKDGLWAGRSLYELYEWAHTPWEWHKALFERATSLRLSSKKMKFFFTRYLTYARERGSPELVAHVKEKARAFVESAGAGADE